MTLKEYIQNNMSEVLKKQEALLSDEINPIFSFDGLEINDLGQAEKVIYDSNGKPISLDDILHLSTEDFKSKYVFKSSQEALEKYLSAYNIYSAEQIMMEYRKNISNAKKKFDKFRNIDNFELAGIQF